jgi:hypothetical protein
MKKQTSPSPTSLLARTPTTEEVLQRLALKANVSIASVRIFAKISAVEYSGLFSAQAAQKAFAQVKSSS